MNLHIRLTVLFLALFLCGSVTCSAKGSLSADEILKRTDNIRFPSGEHRFRASVTFYRPNESAETGTYEVLTKGHDRTLIEMLKPATDHGNSILMVNRDLWIFIKDVSQPVRISFQQRLMGDVANGDLARANFVGDYTPTLIKHNKLYYVLQLTAKSDDVTYAQILLEIEKATFRPVKTQFFAASGKLLKTGTYDNYQLIEGVRRPTRMIFDNPLVKGQRSEISYSQVSTENLPDKYFTKDYLKKLKY